jgi:hypothetical protein
MIEKRDLGSPETVTIHIGTNDLRKRNLDFIMGEVYALETTEKSKILNCKLVLSEVLLRREMSWQHIGAPNDRFNWVANTVGITFIDPNSWIEDRDFVRYGLHLNGRGKRRL